MSTVRRRKSNQKLLIGVGVLVLVVSGVFFLTRPDGDESLEAAPDITLDYFDGESESLSELVGQPVILNFWASWCPACIAEMPALGDVHRRFGDQVEFIGMNMQEVDLDAAEALVQQTGVEYRLAHDPQGLIYREFGGVAMPTTVFITEEGEIARVHAGTIFEDDLAGLIETELLG